MGKLIPFPEQKVRHSRAAYKLVAFADHIDHHILNAMADPELSGHEVAGVLAHRLGALLKTLDHKSDLWLHCEELLKKQAKID